MRKSCLPAILVLFFLPGCARYNPPSTAASDAASRPASRPAGGSTDSASTQTATSAMANQCRTIYFTGRVQGVGFRQTTVDLSRGLGLAGEVKNLSDGRVELVVEGAPADIERLLKRLGEHFGSYIRKVEQTTSTPQGLSPGVRITY